MAPGRNDPCWCGSGQKYKKCHLEQDRAGRTEAPPQRARARRAESVRGNPHLIKTPAQIEGIRRAGAVTRDILDLIEARIGPGATTDEIDRWVYETTLARGGYPSPLHYKGFPKSVCTSVNEVVCHGIPGARVLVEGDIINVDVTTTLDGFIGDASRTYLIGRVSEQARRLVEVTRECLYLGIDQVRPGGYVGDIGEAIQRHAEAHGYSVVRDFVGHGTGIEFHEEPQIPHFGRRGTGHPLLPGMVFTIEPMINAGDWRIRILPDRWTAVTADGSLSAQFEHTLAVTENGVDILTK
ncbi:MAG: type I methionyl aminopeptidase [Candidatus Lambdaproteobacteria bacterium]|nr:type I methionyl aminopeptidase [Candidatus Lambdaproteobacteria bacterium]